MSTGSDNAKSRESSPYKESHFSDHPDDYVDSCSCTDVTLDETLKINHNHRKSLARKKKLQSQRLRELQKAEQETSALQKNSQRCIDREKIQEEILFFKLFAGFRLAFQNCGFRFSNMLQRNDDKGTFVN